MAGQLVGVLREVAAGVVDLGPVDSPLFSDNPLARDAGSADRNWADLAAAVPLVKVDPSDPTARILATTLALPDQTRRLEVLQRAMSKFPQSLELKLRVAAELFQVGSIERAEKTLAEVKRQSPRDWRGARDPRPAPAARGP